MNSILLKNNSALAFVFLLLISLNSFSQEEYTKINVSDDVWVSEAEPFNNKDGETDMGVTITTRDSRETFLKFDISDLYGKGGLVSAALSFVGAQSNNTEWSTIPEFFVVAYECSNDWSEKTITWETKLAPTSEIIGEVSVLEPMRYEITGTNADPESIKKCIENAMKNHAQFISFILKGKVSTNNSRIWISDKGWEPAAIEITQDLSLEEPGDSGVDPESLTISTQDNITTITEDNGTLQMISTITPAEADPRVIWSVSNETGEARISPDGLLTALKDGIVTVQVETPDGWFWETMDITISGQNYTWDERNYIPNGDFARPGDWFGHLSVDNGVGVFAPDYQYELAENAVIWNFMTIPYSKRNEKFIFSFKIWAQKDRSIFITMFDKKIGTFGTSADFEAMNGTSSWTIEHIPLSPTWYTFHVSFPNMPVDCTQDLNFGVGLSTAPVYIDSISLMTVDDYALKSPINQKSFLKVYPNPVSSGQELTVSLSKENENVSIYNTVGQKVMEKIADGNVARFNVNSLTNGIYIVKLKDGTNVKFVKY